MDNLYKILLAHFNDVLHFSGTWGLLGLAIIIFGFCAKNFTYRYYCIIIGIILIIFCVAHLLKRYIDFKNSKNTINFTLHSLCPEEKDILHTMLKQKTNYCELKIPHNFDINQQTQLGVKLCRMISLKDKSLLDLTQVQFTDNCDLLKGTMPFLVWNVLNKKYKQDPHYFVRISNSKQKKAFSKCCRRLLRKKK